MTAPGLKGTYEGTCIACLRPTDTALAFAGQGEWLIAALVVLGVPQDQAYLTLLDGWLEQGLQVPAGRVPGGRLTQAFRVCRDCVRASGCGFPDPVLAVNGARVPVIGQALPGPEPS